MKKKIGRMILHTAAETSKKSSLKSGSTTQREISAWVSLCRNVVIKVSQQQIKRKVKKTLFELWKLELSLSHALKSQMSLQSISICAGWAFYLQTNLTSARFDLERVQNVLW